MRMRRKKHRAERLAACSELLFSGGEEPFCEGDLLFCEGKKKIFLEIGCGKGGFSCQMAERHTDACYYAMERVTDCVVIAAERAAAMAAQPGETSAEEPVAVAARVVKANGSTSIEVNMKIHPGFHVYRAVAASDAYLPVKFTTQVPAGMEVGEVVAPTAKPFGTAGTTIYEDAVTFAIPLTGQATGEVSCKVEWQCCDAHVCMPPMERELKLTL